MAVIKDKVGERTAGLIKGFKLEEERERNCGALLRWFPIREANDILDIILFRRRAVDEEKLPMQLHSHPDKEEYWYVIEGSGRVWQDDEIIEVEEGDLVITPPGVGHKAEGDVLFLCFMTRYNSAGESSGTVMPMTAIDDPYREDPTRKMKPGEYVEVDIVKKTVK